MRNSLCKGQEWLELRMKGVGMSGECHPEGSGRGNPLVIIHSGRTSPHGQKLPGDWAQPMQGPGHHGRG